MKNNTPNSRYDMVLIALFAALLAVLGLVPKIDLPIGVPITMQTLGVMLAGCLLGARRAALSMLLFLLAVALGLPLLSGGRGGLPVFTQASAGYLLSWPLAAAFTGWLMQMAARETAAAQSTASPRRLAIGAFVASIIGGIGLVHLCGVIGLVVLAHMDWSKAALGTLVFVPGDLIKAVVCALVVQTVARGMPDWQFDRRSSQS